jgi:hypothetical protein
MAFAFNIDTLAFAKKLKNAGIDEQHAEAIAEGITQGVTVDISDLATKADLNEVELAMKADLNKVENSLRGEIKDLGAELRGEIKDLGAELRGEIAEVRMDLKWMKIIGGAIAAMMAAEFIKDMFI